MDETSEQRPQSAERGRVLADISNSMVGLHRRYYGRGPTRAKTYIHEDYVFCVLEDIFTTVEQTLIGAGELQRVRDTRLKFQDAMESEFRGAVEEHTGRKVRAFLSQTHVDPDLTVELFLLEPELEPDGDQPSSGSTGP
jgi:uncharacterized protein YbcI